MNRLLSTFRALQQATEQLDAEAPTSEILDSIIEARLARPADDELLAYWFARYLSIRQSLWILINDCLSSGDRQSQDKTVHTLSDIDAWSYFVIGYSAACLLIKNDQQFLFTIARHSVMQRKFNEAFSDYRIPRKQYTAIFAAFVNGRDALRIRDAIHAARRNRGMLEHLKEHPIIGELAAELPTFEIWLAPSKRTYLQRLLAYASHKCRRKSLVVLNNMLSMAVENVGRAASGVQLPMEKRVPSRLREQMIDVLEPGDVLVTRHDTALTNLFIPGFWPHAALYIGTVEQRNALGLDVQPDVASKWCGQHCVLEALKDGVRFRPITETLAVDNFVVLRPNLSREHIQQGIERAIRHEGKLYNYDFDFFSADRLVCSEVVYRAFDGLGKLRFPLTLRAGRHTLSPEDLVKFAIDSNAMQIVGIYGVEDSRTTYTTGDMAEALAMCSIGD